MKILVVALFALVLGMGGFVIGARSTRPDLTLTEFEELSLLRAEVSLQAAQHAAANEKDPAKAKELTTARDAKQKYDLGIADQIRKAHRCETCIFRWYLETDGSLKLQAQPPASTPK